jgi:N,N'-diacetyllegionaminate synthase
MMDNSNHVFVIAEAGSNWKCGSYEDDLERSKSMIRIAKDAGADAIKFQTYKSETTYAQNAGSSEYLKDFGIDQEINELISYLSMPYEMISQLAKYCEEIGIPFMSSPFSVRDAQEIDPYVKIHKIASFEINHIRLLEFLAQTKKPILLSTGASTYDEIKFAITLLKKHGNTDLTLLQCTSSYPCPIDAMNLSAIPDLIDHYGLSLGLSDHSIHPTIAPIMAIGFGARVIEKHFTLDKNFSGPDHKFALNPIELKEMISTIRESEKTIGSGTKTVLPEEMELRNFAKRSLQAIKNISKGEILHEGINFDILRPGNNIQGIAPRFIDKIEGKKAKKDYVLGEGILESE